jgi:hypothetical protein
MNKSEVENLGGLSLEYLRQISTGKPIKTRQSDFDLKGTVHGDDSTLSMTMGDQKLNQGQPIFLALLKFPTGQMLCVPC